MITAPDLLRRLLVQSIVLGEDWDALPASRRAELEASVNPVELVNLLAKEKLLTDYQASRVIVGKTFGLILGNYRVLERIGAGGMGVVYKAEHVRMRRLAAVKVLALNSQGPDDPQLLTRFFTEMRAVASLHHPNIVSAIDAGDVRSPNPELPVLHYYVMDYVAGRDLEDHVMEEGPLPPSDACDLVYQVASALAEANRHQMVHRDIKPANILVTPDRQAKLLDFGLARHFSQRLTEPGTILGTVDYMAPEQVRDSSTVDIRADIYSLGGTLFYCLCGQTPFPQTDAIEEQLQARLTQAPPSVRRRNPAVGADLDAVVRRMMALHPSDRYPNPEAVMSELMPFVRPEINVHSSNIFIPTSKHDGATATSRDTGVPQAQGHRVLLVDDQPQIHTICRFGLESVGLTCLSAFGGAEALTMLESQAIDVVLLDVDMPEMNGKEVLKQLRQRPPCPHLKIIMASGQATADEMALLLQAGADDYLVKPFSLLQLRARLMAILQLKDAQDRADALLHRQTGVASDLAQGHVRQQYALEYGRGALILVLCQILEQSRIETKAQMERVRRFVRMLAEKVASSNPELTPDFIKEVECCAPLHDLGKLAVPQHLLLQPSQLSVEDELVLQEHSALGAEMLREVAAEFGSSFTFLLTAIDVIRSHHERWDGTGYPDGLAGEAIPLAARMTSLAEVYDTIRSRKVYKPGLPHAAAVHIIEGASATQFDPVLVEAFKRCAPAWEECYRSLPDASGH